MNKKAALLLMGAVLPGLLSGCGKTPSLSQNSVVEEAAQLDGLELSLSHVNRQAVTYTVTNRSGTPFCYEGHMLGFLEKQENDTWKTLNFREDLAMTADFRYAEITAEPTTETLNVEQWYGCRLNAGRYRLVVKGYASYEDLEQAVPERALTAWAEFEIE